MSLVAAASSGLAVVLNVSRDIRIPLIGFRTVHHLFGIHVVPRSRHPVRAMVLRTEANRIVARLVTGRAFQIAKMIGIIEVRIVVVNAVAVSIRNRRNLVPHPCSS